MDVSYHDSHTDTLLLYKSRIRNVPINVSIYSLPIPIGLGAFHALSNFLLDVYDNLIAYLCRHGLVTLDIMQILYGIDISGLSSIAYLI